MSFSAVVESWKEVPSDMANLLDAPASVVTRAGVKSPTWDASLLAADSGRVACAMAAVSGPCTAQGTGMSQPGLSAHAPEPVFGQTPTRNPYIYKTRVAATGGGAPGSHPAREPEPV
jgi:hypothetical protein